MVRLSTSVRVAARLAAWGMALTIGVLARSASAAEIKLLAPNAVKEPVQQVVAAFEKDTGHTVVMAWAGTEAITQRVGAGERADVVLNAAQNIDKLGAEGHLVAATRTDFARSPIGIAVRNGVAKPDVSSADALKRALLEAPTIAISSGTSGRHLEGVFARLGLEATLKGRIKQPPSGAQIGQMLARGEADLGFQQVSELLHAPGIQYLGPMPAELQMVTVYSGAVHARATEAAAARALLERLRAPAAREALARAGLDPP